MQKQVNMNYIVGVMIVAFVVESYAADLPSHFKRCQHKSPDFLDCLSQSVTNAVVSMADGLKSLKILPLEPLAVDRVSIGDNGGVVSIKQDYKNIKVHGLTRGLKIKYEYITEQIWPLLLQTAIFLLVSLSKAPQETQENCFNDWLIDVCESVHDCMITQQNTDLARGCLDWEIAAADAHPSVSPDFLEVRSTNYNERVEFIADYDVDGKILLLPVKGNGRSNNTMYGLVTKNTISFEKFEKDGESYLRMTNYKIKWSPKKVTFDFTNLFNGDEALSTQMNKFLNENSETVFKETQGAFEETFGLLYANIANKIFSRVPINKIYSD